ncbi:MAG: hypothetical protein ACP5N3_06555 [Candidatus Nanoarchaeia archaeon]
MKKTFLLASLLTLESILGLKTFSQNTTSGFNNNSAKTYDVEQIYDRIYTTLKDSLGPFVEVGKGALYTHMIIYDLERRDTILFEYGKPSNFNIFSDTEFLSDEYEGIVTTAKVTLDSDTIKTLRIKDYIEDEIPDFGEITLEIIDSEHRTTQYSEVRALIFDGTYSTRNWSVNYFNSGIDSLSFDGEFYSISSPDESILEQIKAQFFYDSVKKDSCVKITSTYRKINPYTNESLLSFSEINDSLIIYNIISQVTEGTLEEVDLDSIISDPSINQQEGF